MKAAREAWFEGQLDLDPAKLIFIDETGASTKPVLGLDPWDGAPARPGKTRRAMPRRNTPWPLEDDDLYRRIASQWAGRTDGAGRSHGRRSFPRLHRTVFGA